MSTRYIPTSFYGIGAYGALAINQRNFTTLASAGNKHYTVPEVSLTGDFEIEIDFTKVAGGIQALCGQQGSGGSFLAFVNNSNILSVNINFTSQTYTMTDVADGKLHKLIGIRTSDQLEVFLDGVSLGSKTLAGTMTLGLIGANNAPSNFWNGILANLKIWDGGNRTTGTLIRNYKIDETWDGPSTVAVDSGSDGSNGTAVNITSSDSENFNFDGSVSPNTWTNDGETIVLEVAGT